MTEHDAFDNDRSAADPHPVDPAESVREPAESAPDHPHAAASASENARAAHGEPQVWSGGPAPTAAPFWSDEVTHVEAPLYRGDEPNVEPARDAVGPTPAEPAASVDPQAPTAHDPWAASAAGGSPTGHPGAGAAWDPAGSSAPGYAAPGAYAKPHDAAPGYLAAGYPGAHTGPLFAAGDQPGGGHPVAGSDTATYAAVPGGGPDTAVSTQARPKRMRAMLIGTAVVAALIGGATGAGTFALEHNHNSATGSSGISVTNNTAPASAVTNGTVASAAKQITPSVVTIQVTGSSESGTGSGVILRSDGYILTNDHVVSVAGTGGSIVVQLSDGRSAKATIVGTDSTDDLAVIKVNLTGLTAATFANSSALTVGQSVVAVGAPLDLADTVTSGIVSATARTVRSGDNDQAVFAAVQTDAAINPGNSGGALVDLNGDVIGINAAIASTSSSGVTVPGQPATQSGSIGIGFAIPSNEASRIAAELIATGKASHAVLGVEVSSATSATSAGAKLAAVTKGGGAASAGLEAGDVVTAVDGSRINTGDDLIAAIRAHAVKDSVSITYTRDGASHTVKVTLNGASS